MGKASRLAIVAAFLWALAAHASDERLVLTLDASVSQSRASLLAGTSSGLTARLAAGRSKADMTARVRSWKSSNPSVANVDGAGRVQAVAPGSATITAEVSRALEGSVSITVTSLAPPVFVVQPGDTGVSRPIFPAVSVQARDSLGNPLAGLPVTIRLGARPAPGELGGLTRRLTDATGVAEFAGLSIDWLGSGYTLVATVLAPNGATAAATSAAFDELRVGDPCLAPEPACAGACADADGDGLNDAWEIAGGIDMNGDGVIDATRDVLLPGANADRPDIYVQYAYMGWGTPGAACTVDSDCTAGGLQPNLVCHEQRCNHNHRPDPRALQLVVDAFARHGVALHIDPEAHEVPHSQVVTFAQAGDGAKAACAGADIEAGVLGGAAASFFDIKKQYFQPKRKLAYHYTVFGHSNTCVTDDPTASVGACSRCPSDRATPSGMPAAGGSGLAELPGNDFIVSLAHSYFNPVASVPRNPFVEAGAFMHELGHNLGLHHAGDVPQPDRAPNYLSVMNSRYVLGGILQGALPGSTQLAPCAVDGDCTDGGACRSTPAGGRCVRIDYSTSTLNTLDESALDEAAGVSPLSSNLRDMILYDDANGIQRRAPAAGPVDWNGNGAIDGERVAVDLNSQSDATPIMRGYNDWDHGACTTSADCPVNAVRQQIHDLIDSSVDPREPCVRNRCQPQWRAFQCTPWGRKD